MGHTVCVLQCYNTEGVGCRTGWPCNIVWTRWPRIGISIITTIIVIIITIIITTTTATVMIIISMGCQGYQGR